ncbi:MAG TPA: TadE/TadG family type IV pilus assembly protein [Acidimicrobiia bacterium]
MKRLCARAAQRRGSRGGADERGASLVEFALLAPLLLLLLLGMVEFGWLFAQNLDVRHGAREGARLAAVNYPEGAPPNSGVRSDANRDALVAETCVRMRAAAGATVEVTSSGAVADPATVTVSLAPDTLTGFIDFLLPSALTLDSTVEIHLEQSATWSNTVGPQTCP